MITLDGRIDGIIHLPTPHPLGLIESHHDDYFHGDDDNNDNPAVDDNSTNADDDNDDIDKLEI